MILIICCEHMNTHRISWISKSQMWEQLSSRVPQTWNIYADEPCWFLVVAQHLSEDASKPVWFRGPRGGSIKSYMRSDNSLKPIAASYVFIHVPRCHKELRNSKRFRLL